MKVEPATNTDVMALSAMHFEDCKTVHKFMGEAVRPVLDRVGPTHDASHTVRGTFMRAQGWLGTFHKLDSPAHFQAVIAGTRALFEIAVDLAFMHHARTAHPVEKMLAWERSSKLRAAERTRDYYAANPNRTMPDHLTERVRSIDRDGAAIRAERQTWWKEARHPERWTGTRNGGLREDAATADTFGPYSFREFYDVRFAELCWGTHGSGLAGVRGLNAEYFPGPVAMAFEDAAMFAVLSSELALRYCGQYDAIAEARFRRLNEEERPYWKLKAFKTQKGEPP